MIPTPVFRSLYPQEHFRYKQAVCAIKEDLVVQRVGTVAFQGVEVLDIDVEVQISPGCRSSILWACPIKPSAKAANVFAPRSMQSASSIPHKRVTVNLAPADVLKEGSHFDLPIALGVLAAMGVFPGGDCAVYGAGRIVTDGSIRAVAGVLPAAISLPRMNAALSARSRGGSEAVWAGDRSAGARELCGAGLNHMKGTQVLSRPQAQR